MNHLLTDCPEAPWNNANILPDECPECGSSDIDIWEQGSYKGKEWTNYKCNDCDHRWGNEPDWDSMKGGHDNY
jgi:DNA-directed RNA polymerase subunit M/transcription elongation factor TFIIS